MPRILGLNPLAVLVAGLAFWMVGALWYGALFADLWFGLWGFVEADEARMEAVVAPAMTAGLIQCLLFAGFLATALKAVKAEGLTASIKWAVFFWAGFVLLAQAYGAIYAWALSFWPRPMAPSMPCSRSCCSSLMPATPWSASS